MATVSPATTAVPSALATSSATRKLGVVSLVRLSVVETPLSELAIKSIPGVAGATLSRTVLWATVTASRLAAAEMSTNADLASSTAALLATEPPEPLLKSASTVLALAKFKVVEPVTAPLISLTKLPMTASTACVAVLVPAGAAAASASVVATCAAAFCIPSAWLSVADKGS